jgi:predicted DCC family thiol-disulfide oxidoreductase YuxK
MNHRVTYGYYALIRFAIGLYATVHFAALLPYGAELFSCAGILPDRSLSPLASLFPSPLLLCDAPWMVTLLLVTASLSGLSLAAGKREGVCALLIWWISTSLFDRNPLIANPSLPYLGWMMLAIGGMSLLRKRSEAWEFPRELFWASWVVMALGYSYSGYTKLMSPSWLDGSAIREVLLNPLSRDSWLVSLLLEQAPWILEAATWGALLLECLFAPLSLSGRLRPWLWLAMSGMHLCLLALIRFADLSLAMLLFHLFTFDPGWIAPSSKTDPIICFFDGACGLCHGFVRFLTQEGVADGLVRVAPQSGPLFKSLDPDPAFDSIAVYLPASGKWLWKSQAVAAVLMRIGGIWRPLGTLLHWLPSSLSDWGYDVVAHHRHTWFRRPSPNCLLLPSGWQPPDRI